MRISDWSSDVCSSDLNLERWGNHRIAIGRCQAEVEIDFLTHVRERIEKRIPMVLYRNARHCVGRVAMPRSIGQGKLREYCREGELGFRSEEHTSELQSLMRISYAVFCLRKKITT